MRIVGGIHQTSEKDRGGILVLGFLDGVHRGHQVLLGEARAMRSLTGKSITVLTFDQHPLTVVDPARAPRLLTTIEEKASILDSLGTDLMIVEPFTLDFSKITPAQFLTHVLQERIAPAWVIAGYNYRFGHQHKGTVQLLRQMAPACGFEVKIVQPVYVGSHLVSSSLIRGKILAGRVAMAEQLLDRWYFLKGVVEEGKRRGTEFGISTANLVVPREKILPKDGVYAGVARCEDEQIFMAAINVGSRPTFGESEVQVEAHLLDFQGNLYHSTIELAFVKRLRDEKRFPSPEELFEQIRHDIVRTRRTLEKVIHTQAASFSHPPRG